MRGTHRLHHLSKPRAFSRPASSVKSPAPAPGMPRCDDSGVTANQPNEAREATHPSAQDEVADICRDLIRIDTSNRGDHSGPGERAAAEYVAGLLDEVGVPSTMLESHPGRASVVARIAGEDPQRPALLIHGHLDVVPADAADWRVPPFSGEITGGCVWGRGSVA